MTVADLLADAFGRIREEVHAAVDGLRADDLAYRPDPESNSVGWLIWHLTRVTDDHRGRRRRHRASLDSEGWAARFGLPFDVADTGYGHDSSQVGAVRVASGELLTGYFDAVFERASATSGAWPTPTWTGSWTIAGIPPVTLGVRLVSVISDDLQHAGQAAYLRGLLRRYAPQPRYHAAGRPAVLQVARPAAERAASTRRRIGFRSSGTAIGRPGQPVLGDLRGLQHHGGASSASRPQSKRNRMPPGLPGSGRAGSRRRPAARTGRRARTPRGLPGGRPAHGVSPSASITPPGMVQPDL